MPRNETAIQTLQLEKALKKLVRAAQELAASRDPEDHTALLPFLKDAAFRDRLDPPDAETTGPEDMNLGRVLRTLGENKMGPGHDSILKLIADPDFTSDPDRVDMLLRATVNVRPAPPQVISFWKKVSDPEGVHMEIAVAVAVENKSAPAILFFQERMLDKSLDEESRILWMHEWVMPNRANTDMLAMCHRLITGPAADFSNSLKLALAESLFEYRPEEWFGPHHIPTPEPRRNTRRPGRDSLREIAQFVLEKLSPGPALKLAIETTVKELDALDKVNAP